MPLSPDTELAREAPAERDSENLRIAHATAVCRICPLRSVSISSMWTG